MEREIGMTWDELNQHELVVYSTNWCPDCRRFKQSLGKHQIRYCEIDIDADADAAARLQRKTGRSAIPFLEIDGGPMVRGWHAEKASGFDEALFLAEVAAALV